MKNKAIALILVVFLTALTAVTVLNSAAEQIPPPEIYVPEDSHFKFELSLPSEVNAGTSFSGSVYIKRLYSDIAASSSIYGKFEYDHGLFAVKETSYNGDGYTLKISKDGFSLVFDKTASADYLADLAFSVDFVAQKRTSDEQDSIERVYITLDRVTIVSPSGDIYEGVGAVGYTKFVFAKNPPAIELPPLPFDESSDNVVDSSDESNDSSEPHFEESSEISHEESFEESLEESYDVSLDKSSAPSSEEPSSESFGESVEESSEKSREESSEEPVTSPPTGESGDSVVVLLVLLAAGVVFTVRKFR